MGGLEGGGRGEVPLLHHRKLLHVLGKLLRVEHGLLLRLELRRDIGGWWGGIRGAGGVG